ncbi:MAG TPA: hypothetical protein VN420_03520 [Candidatus Fimivivens sp.]|nr:hypothetical protein [Candidatus Fimivivens sp.]
MEQKRVSAKFVTGVAVVAIFVSVFSYIVLSSKNTGTVANSTITPSTATGSAYTDTSTHQTTAPAANTSTPTAARSTRTS